MSEHLRITACQNRCFPVEFTKFLRTSNLGFVNDCFWNLFFHLDCPFLITYTSGSKWYTCFSFCIMIYSFVCQYSLRYYWCCYNQKQVSGAVLQKERSYKFWKIDKKTPKKRFRLRCFHVNSAKFLITSFFKEPIGRLLQHKHSFCLLSHYYLSHFQKWCHTYFLLQYFLGLICRLGTRVSSIFQTLR